MKATDLNVQIPNKEPPHDFVDIARRLGFAGIAVPFQNVNSFQDSYDSFPLYSRMNLLGHRLGKLKGSIGSLRRKAVIVAVPLSNPSIDNWAAEDERVDLLSLGDSSVSDSLKHSTAKLAAKSATALEVTIRPLLEAHGFKRSRFLKFLRENIATATDAGMEVVLSSGATEPLMMRAPRSLYHIGRFLGLREDPAKRAVFQVPSGIVKTNMRKLTKKFASPGVEIMEEG